MKLCTTNLRLLTRCLERIYGVPQLGATDTPSDQGDPIGTLVGTILSQNTTDVNAKRAYEALKRKYPQWEQVLEADDKDIISAIGVAGLGPTKAVRIKRILKKLKDAYGTITLDFLRDMDAAEAYAFLINFDGIGPKTAACVLLFAFSKPLFPVDTHIRRVCTRLGLINTRGLAMAQVAFRDHVSPEDVLSLHINLINHGRQICRPKPHCHKCVLSNLCTYGSDFKFSEG